MSTEEDMASLEYADPFRPLFHWSPRSRRKGIERYGLKPGSMARDGQWRPPFICLSDDPLLAWQLSGRFAKSTGETWDLWVVIVRDLPHMELITDTFTNTGRPYVKEVRVYERVYKRDVRWVAERTT